MRRAEWRRRADDPKTLLGWWWRGVVGGNARYVLLGFATAVSVVAGLHLIVWPLILTGGYAFAIGLTNSRRVPDRLRPMLPIPAPEGQFRVSVEYRRKGLKTGQDEMALCVVDGWLVAEGVRSNFALRPEDVREARMWDERMDHGEKLLLSDGTGIRLRGVAFNSAARDVIARWRQGGPVKGEPTFPPARVHPSEIARWSAWFLAGFFLGGVWQFAAGLFAHITGYLLYKDFGALLGLVIALYTVRRLWLLMRIDHQAQQALESEDARKVLTGGAPPLQAEVPEPLTAKRSSP